MERKLSGLVFVVCAIWVGFLSAQPADDDFLLLFLPAILAATKDKPTPPPPPPPTAGVPGPAQNVPPTDDCAFEILGPTLSVNRTLVNTPSRCDYLIHRPGSNLDSQVLQLDGVRLTIQPGVVVRLARGLEISVLNGGQIRAIGQPGNRIRFESAGGAQGSSDGISFRSGSLASRFDHVDFINIGDDSPTSEIPDATIDGSSSAGGVTLNYVSFNRSANFGVDLTDLPINAFSNNGFYNNASYPIEIGANQIHKLDKLSVYQSTTDSNIMPYISVHGQFEPAVAPATWKNLNAPYRVFMALIIESGAHITIQPGTRFIMDESASVDVKEGGSLRAVGTPSDPIIFTGLEQTPGYWRNIDFGSGADSTLNRLEYVSASYGGDGFSFKGIVTIGSNARATIINNTITNSSSSGVCINPSSFANYAELINNNTYSNNSGTNVILSNDC